MEQTKEFALTLDDRPGTLAKATERDRQGGHHIEGYCAVPSGKGWKRHFPRGYLGSGDDPQSTRDRRLQSSGRA